MQTLGAEAWIDEARQDIRAGRAALADETYEIRNIVPTGGEIIGVRIPQIKSLAKEFRTSHRGLRLSASIDLLEAQTAAGSGEESLFGIFLLVQYRREFSPEIWGHIDQLVDYIDNWEVCDQLAMNIAGEVVAKRISLVDELVLWAGSPNPWRQRFVLATATVLNQQGRSHPYETLRVCEPLMADAEPSVQKAIGWALREATKRDERAVFALLERHKGVAPRRVLREASGRPTPEHRKVILDD